MKKCAKERFFKVAAVLEAAARMYKNGEPLHGDSGGVDEIFSTAADTVRAVAEQCSACTKEEC